MIFLDSSAIETALKLLPYILAIHYSIFFFLHLHLIVFISTILGALFNFPARLFVGLYRK